MADWALRINDLSVYSHRCQDLRTKDTGVYECRVEFGENYKRVVTVAVFALHVTTDVPTLFPRETEPLNLDCHSETLARLLHSLDLTLATDPLFGCKVCSDSDVKGARSTRQWFHNDTETSLLPLGIPATRPSPDTLTSSTRDMSGVWRCDVTHNATSRRWTTGWYRVFVKDPPSDLELFWRSALKQPWLVALVGG